MNINDISQTDKLEAIDAVQHFGAGGVAQGMGSTATGAISAYTNAKQTDLDYKRQELAEKYAPLQAVLGGVQAAGAAVGGVGDLIGGIGKFKVAGKKEGGPVNVSLEGAEGAQSDERVKDIIAPAEEYDPIDAFALGLEPFYYKYKEGTPSDDGGKTHIGISAQELAEIPGVTSVEEGEDGILFVDPAQQVLVNVAVISVLCKHVQLIEQTLEQLGTALPQQLGTVSDAVTQISKAVQPLLEAAGISDTPEPVTEPVVDEVSEKPVELEDGGAVLTKSTYKEPETEPTLASSYFKDRFGHAIKGRE
jgi:hypothetical protein